MQALLAEITGRSREYRDRLVTSVFLGGGTPSLLTDGQMKRLLGTVYGSFCAHQIHINIGKTCLSRLAVSLQELLPGMDPSNSGKLPVVPAESFHERPEAG